jgi:predicted methyltransferase
MYSQSSAAFYVTGNLALYLKKGDFGFGYFIFSSRQGIMSLVQFEKNENILVRTGLKPVSDWSAGVSSVAQVVLGGI